MPKLSQLALDLPAKVLVVGDGGTGKTTTLAGLAKAGYRIFLQNFDGDSHLQSITMHLTPEEMERIYAKTYKDDLGLKNGRVQPLKPPVAFPNAMHDLEHWKEDGEDMGGIRSWGPMDVYALDGLTSMGRAAMWHRLFTNGRFNATKAFRREKDWGESMELQENFLDMLTSANIKCNVVVFSHLTTISADSGGDDDDDDENGAPKTPVPSVKSALDTKRFPSALGRKLPPKVPGMFSAVVEAKIIGAGRNAKRVIRTIPSPDVDVKVPALGLPSEIDNLTALVRIFEAVKSGKAKAA